MVHHTPPFSRSFFGLHARFICLFEAACQNHNHNHEHSQHQQTFITIARMVDLFVDLLWEQCSVVNLMLATCSTNIHKITWSHSRVFISLVSGIGIAAEEMQSLTAWISSSYSLAINLV
jgi:hypothetical protein